MAVVVYVPSRLGEGFFTDLPAPTAGDDAKAITYDHGTGAFVYAAAGGGGTPGGSNTQVQYNNAGAFAGDAGMTYDAATDRLTVAGGLVAPSIRPASDSTTALQWQNAAGAYFMSGDSTNGRVGIGTNTPAARLDVNGQFIARAPNTAFAFVPIADNAGRAFQLQTRDYVFASVGSALDVSFTGGSGNVGLTMDQYSNGKTAGNNLHLQYYSGGKVSIGVSVTPTALLDIAASSTARASLRVRSGVAPSTTNADGDIWNDGSTIAMRVNGTNAVNTDGGLSIWMQSSTTMRNVGRVLWQYTDKTDATRKSMGSLTAYDASTEYKAIRWGANGEALLSFYDVTTPIARQVLATGAGASVDDVIAALQNLGLVKQS